MTMSGPMTMFQMGYRAMSAVSNSRSVPSARSAVVRLALPAWSSAMVYTRRISLTGFVAGRDLIKTNAADSCTLRKEGNESYVSAWSRRAVDSLLLAPSRGRPGY